MTIGFKTTFIVLPIRNRENKMQKNILNNYRLAVNLKSKHLTSRTRSNVLFLKEENIVLVIYIASEQRAMK